MTFTISGFHIPILIFLLVTIWQTINAATSKERDPFYGLSLFLPTLGFLILTGLYYGAYYWFKFIA